jgi:hypothetical protein
MAAEDFRAARPQLSLEVDPPWGRSMRPDTRPPCSIVLGAAAS